MTNAEKLMLVHSSVPVKSHKLGKRAPHADVVKVPKFKDYLLKSPKEIIKELNAALPTPTAEVSWITKVPTWPMFLNDTLGDCVIAAMGHMVQQWTAYAGTEVTVTDNDILAAYEVVGDYQPGNPNTDQGADMLTALKYWQKTGLAGNKIQAYAVVDPTNDEEIRLAQMLFGNVYAGLGLPASAENETAWTVTEGGTYSPNGTIGSWGGHCVPFMASSPVTRTCVTWGTTLKASHNFFLDYVDELYAVLSPEWIAAAGLSPSHFDLAQLQTDLTSVEEDKRKTNV